ncbi:MAG: hypothetical protein ACJAR9_001716, partial [Celeribacter sp.]
MHNGWEQTVQIGTMTGCYNGRAIAHLGAGSFYKLPILKPFDRWFRIVNKRTAPGSIEATVTAITSPMSVWNPNNAVIAMLIGFPFVVVKIRAKTT